MDVRRTARVGDRLDGAEVVFAGGTGEEAAEALEIGVPLRAAVAAFVEINAVMIDLPDFHQRVADRLALRIGHPPAEVRHAAQGGGEAIVQDDEVIVGIQREIDGVKRPLGLLRGERESFRERAGHPEPRSPEGEIP